MNYIITRITKGTEGKTSITNTVKDTIEEARANLYFQASQIYDNLAPSDAVVLLDEVGNRLDGISYVKPDTVSLTESETV